MARKNSNKSVVETEVVVDAEVVVAEPEVVEATMDELVTELTEIAQAGIEEMKHLLPSKGTIYALTEKGAATLGRTGLQTQQRGVLGLGMAWRNGAVKGASLRASALATLFADLEDGNDAIVERSVALAKLATIPLGTKSPVTRLSAFLRAGLLAEIA